MTKGKIIYNIILIAAVVLLTILASGCDFPGSGGGTHKNSGRSYQFLISSESSSDSDRTPVTYTAKNYDQVKAVWISYIELSSILKGKTKSDFTECIQNVYDNVQDMGLNTVIVHVRPYGDAIYPSAYFPWSAYAKAFGEAPDYDPLAIMVEEAHRRSLSFHAWINPYRAQTEEEAGKMSGDFPFSKWYHGSEKGKYVVNCSGRWYYNPGVEAVRQLIISGIKELVQYYEVDGIHMDDYFYPTTDPAFDAEQYQEYQQGGGTLALEAWRRENVNALLRDAYLAIKRINDGVRFGVSPQANISNNFKTQYADVIQWCSLSGYLDYICPQIYYSFKSETTDFEEALAQWIQIAVQPSVQLYIGVAPYKIGTEDKWACTGASGGQCTAPNDCGKNGWKPDSSGKSSILAQEYEKVRAAERCSGIVFYSYNSLFVPASEVQAQVESERAALKEALAQPASQQTTE